MTEGGNMDVTTDPTITVNKRFEGRLVVRKFISISPDPIPPSSQLEISPTETSFLFGDSIIDLKFYEG